MKRILIVLIALCLIGCNSNEKKLKELGYSQKDIEIIEDYPEEIQALFLNEYNYKYADLIHGSNFDINKLEEYAKYYEMYDRDKVIEMVNNNELNDEVVQDIKEEIKITNEFKEDKYYLEKNKDLYIENKDRYETIRQCVEAVNTKTYLDYYTNIEPTDTSKNYLMLINKYHALGSDYEPDDLVDIDSYYGRGKTRAEVYEQYKKMADDAFELGYHFLICSAYRSYDYQDGLYSMYIDTDEGGQASVDTYSARPGHSEHQSGLCLDLSDDVYGMDDFGLSDASKWINENCYKYGFIIRYTAEKESVTGYQAEPWQVRYVGDVNIAKDILDKGITFDEYYACFVEE